MTSALLGLLLAATLAWQADAPGALPRVYRLGDWPAPFGIVLVVDRLSALMLLLTALLALPVLFYASGGWDAHGRHFHPLFQFQLMGLNGAFVTGDLFNLFVFFEVLLIISYALTVHGQGRARLRVGLKYLVLNLAASALFLIGVALVYALSETLNLADLALRVAGVTGADAVLLQAAVLLLVAVWLLLQRSLAPAQLLVAAVIGLAVPLLVDGFLPPAGHWPPADRMLRSIALSLRLVPGVLWDIVRSNLTVARLVLWPWPRPRPAWITVPIVVEHPVAITLLAARSRCCWSSAGFSRCSVRWACCASPTSSCACMRRPRRRRWASAACCWPAWPSAGAAASAASRNCWSRCSCC